MRKFVIKAFLFVAGVVVTLGGWSAFVFWIECSSYKRESIMPPDTVYAVCSDSQTELGLQPSLWPQFFNFSQSGIQLDQMELKTFDLLSRNPGLPKVLLIDISPRKLAKQSIDTPLLKDRSACKRFLLHVLHPSMSRRSLDGMVVLFRDSILLKRSTKALRAPFGKKYSSSIGGSYDPMPGMTEEEARANREKMLARPTKVGFRDYRKLVYASMQEHLDELNSCELVTDRSKTVDCVRSIIGITRSYGVTPVLMTAPLHPEFIAGVKGGRIENFKKVMNDIAKECQVPYLDYLEMPFTEAEWRDANHLNRHGAVRFTERVRADVAKLFPNLK